VVGDDDALVRAGLAGDGAAWSALISRHGAFVRAVAARLLDPEADLEAVVDAAWEELRRPDGPLAGWAGACQLRSALGVTARHATLRHAASVTNPGAAIAPAPTPSGLYLEDLAVSEPSARVEEILAKLPPNVVALVRLRLRGLSRGDMAATLGLNPTVALANLERVAARLAQDGEPELSARCYRALLDAADMPERVELALRTEQDPDARRVRARVEKTWRAVGERLLSRLTPRTGGCLADLALAGFVDGSLRGAARARAEGHVATCARCIDEAAALVLDLRVQAPLREAEGRSETVAVAAACVSTGRFRAAERVTAAARLRGTDGGAIAAIERLAQAGQLLDGERATRGRGSQVVATRVPVEDEAPLVAFESLAQGDARGAARAIDDRMARQSLGARLRLLAAATGDLEHARQLAEALLDAPRMDPGRTLDARAVLALPPGRALPHEIVVDRLRDVLPEAVRFVLARGR